MARALSSGQGRISTWLAEAGGDLAGIFLPAGCRLGPATADERVAAADCLASFPRISGCACQVCGLPLDIDSNDKRAKDHHWERGFNQAELLSKPLAKRLRLRSTGQKTAAAGQTPTHQSRALEAVRGAFATRPGSQVDNKRVLLVDDVMTTGATLDACAKALRAAGATAVVGVTVARAILNPRKVSR